MNTARNSLRAATRTTPPVVAWMPERGKRERSGFFITMASKNVVMAAHHPRFFPGVRLSVDNSFVAGFTA